jgi:hypothetical protein
VRLEEILLSYIQDGLKGMVRDLSFPAELLNDRAGERG